MRDVVVEVGAFQGSIVVHEGDVCRRLALGVESLEVCHGHAVDVKTSVDVEGDARNELYNVFSIIIIITNMCHTNATSRINDCIITTTDWGSLWVVKGACCRNIFGGRPNSLSFCSSNVTCCSSIGWAM